MTKTQNERHGGILALTKPGRENVYNAISALDVENITNHLLDPTSRSLIAAKMQKEAETFFSSISDEFAQDLMGLTPEDWFDADELDRDLTPLIEQQAAETDASQYLELSLLCKLAAKQHSGGLNRRCYIEIVSRQVNHLGGKFPWHHGKNPRAEQKRFTKLTPRSAYYSSSRHYGLTSISHLCCRSVMKAGRRF
jgi:hypothetical protein